MFGACWCLPYRFRLRILGVNTAHKLTAAWVFPHVNAAFVFLETEATNLPVAQLFGDLPRRDFPVWPTLPEACHTHAMPPFAVAHTSSLQPYIIAEWE